MLKKDGSKHFLYCLMTLGVSLIDKFSHLPILEEDSFEYKLITKVTARHQFFNELVILLEMGGTSMV